MRKSFIIHIDSLDVLDELTDEQAGQLFKAISSYHKTGKHDLKGVMNALFIPLKNQFERDNEKYENVCERNKINGLKGGRPKTQKTQSVILGSSGNPKKPRKPDSDSDSKNDNDTKVIDIDNPPWFTGHVIKLNKKDFYKWVEMTGWHEDYLQKILSDRDDWLADNPAKASNWFMSTSNFLQKAAQA